MGKTRRPVSKKRLIDFYYRAVSLNQYDVWYEDYKFEVTKDNKLKLLDISKDLKDKIETTRKFIIPDIFEYIDSETLFSLNIFKNLNYFIADGLLEIDLDIFNNSMIEKVSLKNCRRLCDFCFYNCYNLKKIDIENILYLGKGCFISCSSLSNLYIPNVKEIGDNCFSGCLKLCFDNTKFIRLKNLGSGAMRQTLLKEMEAPALIFLESEVFKDSSIEKFIGERVTHIGMSAFENTPLSVLDIPNIKVLDYRSLSHTQLKYFESNTLKYFSAPFVFCDKLCYVNLPSITRVENMLCCYCMSLQHINLKNCKQAKGGLVEKCDNLEYVDYRSLKEFSTCCFNYTNKKTKLYLNKDVKIREEKIKDWYKEQIIYLN